jgi:hypothetical protein
MDDRDETRAEIHRTVKKLLTGVRRLERMAARFPEDKMLAVMARHLREMLGEIEGGDEGSSR